MSNRVGFVLGGPDGILSHFLTQPLQDFHAWYEGALQEFPEEFDAARWRLLGDIIRQGPPAIDQAPPADVNFLIDDYYGDYANIHGLNQGVHEYWKPSQKLPEARGAVRSTYPAPRNFCSIRVLY